MNYYNVTVKVEKMIINGTDKNGNSVMGMIDLNELSWEHPDNRFLAFNNISGNILNSIEREDKVTAFVALAKQHFKDMQDEYIEKYPKYFNKYSRWSAPIDGIKYFDRYSFVFSVKKNNVKNYSVKRCLEILTVEQFIECFEENATNLIKTLTKGE